MRVIPASRMLSAISFGVFWRSAPSTKRIMRSRKVEPGAAVILTRIQSDRTWVPPVTAERSPPDSRMTGRLTGDRGLVDGGHALDHLAIGGDDVAGLDQHDVTRPEARAGNNPVRPPARAWEPLRLGLGPGSAQGVGLGFAAPLGDRLGEVREQHRKPEPQGDLDREANGLAAGDEIAQEDDGRERGHDLDHEHDRVPD